MKMKEESEEAGLKLNIQKTNCVILVRIKTDQMNRQGGTELHVHIYGHKVRNINDLRYADDTTLMAESKEELKSLLMKMKEESEEVGLKLNIQKAKSMASGSITSWQTDGETMETVTVNFLRLQNHCRW